jgi:hypothetical protein
MVDRAIKLKLLLFTLKVKGMKKVTAVVISFIAVCMLGLVVDMAEISGPDTPMALAFPKHIF